MSGKAVSGIGEFYFQFHILKNCNLRCRHCYQEGYEAAPSAEGTPKLFFIANAIIAAMRKWRMKARIALTGGEPLLSPAFWPLLDFFDASEDVATLTILSNGTLITDEVASRLSSYRKLREVQVSLDGACSSSHNAVRGEGAFEAALKGIRNLKARDIPVAVMFTLMRQNLAEVEGVLDLAERECVNYVTVERVVPCAGNSFSKRDVLTSDEIHAVFSKVNRWAETPTRGVHVRRRRPLWALFGDECGGFCPVGLSALAILEDGTILPCRRLEIPIGNVIADKGVYKAWYTSKVLWDIRDKRKFIGKCGGCRNIEKCGGCRAIAYNITGNYLEEDPQCWMKVQ